MISLSETYKGKDGDYKVVGVHLTPFKYLVKNTETRCLKWIEGGKLVNIQKAIKP